MYFLRSLLVYIALPTYHSSLLRLGEILLQALYNTSRISLTLMLLFIDLYLIVSILVDTTVMVHGNLRNVL